MPNLPDAWVPCEGDIRTGKPALVTDTEGNTREIRKGIFGFVDVPDDAGKMRMVLGIGGRLVARKGKRLLIRFADGQQFWVPFVSEFQLEEAA